MRLVRGRRLPITATVRLTVIGLAFAGGTVDAGTYLGLGHVFPANMTGNTVLLVISVARGSVTELTRAAVALGAYCVGVASGTALLRSGPWPRSARLTLTAEAVVLGALLGSWAAFGLGAHYGLIAAAAVAMGAQSAAVRASHVGGVSTTYVTGTLTTAIARLVGRLRGEPQAAPSSPALPGEAWIVYAMGALAGAFAEMAWHAGVMAIALAIVVASAATGRWCHETQER